MGDGYGYSLRLAPELGLSDLLLLALAGVLVALLTWDFSAPYE
eukprot:CAMPEP_0177609884 /NCGR_PEP_ID=MMETSP0419_2-20121207/19400_1 /TAXON_ID=582737 /ORGANISM="Tetraselmis sp., Strain GSL018" /LENGTH=42 /DNA_ID= /DNA_START= /DNA_END= /DNA_ORIENTATION=